MTSESPLRTGGCLCGQVRFEVDAAEILTMACHCRGCQRLSASAFSLSNMYRTDGFRVTRGAPVIGALHGPSRYLYCPHCLNWLFTRPAGLAAFVNVRATMLDEVSPMPPFMETMTRERLPWATTGARHSFETFPTDKAFPDLLAAFRAFVAS